MNTPSSDNEYIPPPGVPFQGEQPPTHFEREDERWQPGAQVRDWFVLLMMIAIYLAWTGILYFFEPGIR